MFSRKCEIQKLKKEYNKAATDSQIRSGGGGEGQDRRRRLKDTN